MKAYREDKKRIYLLKTTHQRRDLEAYSMLFVKPRLKTLFKYLAQGDFQEEFPWGIDQSFPYVFRRIFSVNKYEEKGNI